MRSMEVPISNSFAPTEIIRCLADSLSYTAIFCQLFGSTTAVDSLAPRIRIPGTIVPLTRVNQAPCRDPPKVATRGSRYDQWIKNAVSRLFRKKRLCARAFAVARLSDFGTLPKEASYMRPMARTARNTKSLAVPQAGGTA